MRRRIGQASWVVGGLLAALALQLTAGSPADEPSPGRDERLRERDRLSEEVSRLKGEGKLTEALAGAEKVLAIEREVLGSVHEDVAGSLVEMAEMHEELGDFVSAVHRGQEVLEVRKRLHGDGHWR